jgi:hypothetical protein
MPITHTKYVEFMDPNVTDGTERTVQKSLICG